MFVALAAEAQNNLSFKTEELKKVAAELKLEGLDIAILCRIVAGTIDDLHAEAGILDVGRHYRRIIEAGCDLTTDDGLVHGR